MATLRRMIRVILFFGLLPLCFTVAAQKKLGLEADKWAMELSKHQLTEVNSIGSLSKLLLAADTVRALRCLDSIAASDYAKGYFFTAHFNMVKASYLYSKFAGYDKYKDRGSKELQPIKEQMLKLYTDALDAAYHTEDEKTVGWVSFYSATVMRSFGETGWAVMYSKNGVDLFEKIGYPVEPPVYTSLAELLYQVKEYDECITYAKKGLVAWGTKNYEKEYKETYKYKIRALNTIGKTFLKRMQGDSANLYFRQALQLARDNKDTLSTGMILGNIGRVIYMQNKYDSAHLLLKMDCESSKKAGFYDNAATALDWAARADLARGSNDAALAEAREAISLLNLWPNGPYERDTYHTLVQIFRAMQHYDSAFYYSERYAAINDSLEKEVVTSSLAISKAKLNDAISRFNIEKLNRQKSTELWWRNIIISSIIIVSIIALLLINRQRLKERIRTEKAEQEKIRMAQEMVVAKDQLRLFTVNIVEKTNLIEKLEQQLKGKDVTTEQYSVISELSQQTILTEEDWNKFKLLFESVHPGFFTKLKEKFPEITVAEQRMAALTRLRLTTKQMAAMLGISVDSVHKSRQRLRQRFSVGRETSIEDLVANL